MARSQRGGKTAFATRVRELRMQKGWSRQEFADQVGVSRTAVGNWETGRCLPNLHKWDDICKALGTDKQDLHLPPYD